VTTLPGSSRQVGAESAATAPWSIFYEKRRPGGYRSLFSEASPAAVDVAKALNSRESRRQNAARTQQPAEAFVYFARAAMPRRPALTKGRSSLKPSIKSIETNTEEMAPMEQEPDHVAPKAAEYTAAIPAPVIVDLGKRSRRGGAEAQEWHRATAG